MSFRGLTLVLLALVASPLVPHARAQLNPVPTDSNVAAASCTSSSQYNRNIYSSDPQVTSLGQCNFPTKCTLPTKNCNCTNDGWVVAPWKVYTQTTFQGNYLDSTQTTYGRPYIKSVVNRTTCCSLCGSNNKYSHNGTMSNYYPASTNASAPYVSNGTKVMNCNYWLHYIPAGGVSGSGCVTSGNNVAASSLCGYCVIYPVGTNPTCNNVTTCTEVDGSKHSASNYATVGKGCPGGTNDPHFVGAKGTHFDFNGVPDESFCLLADNKYQVNMKMRGYYDSRTVGASVLRNGMAVRTWIKDLGILWLDSASGVKRTLRIWARDGKSQTRDEGFLGGMELDGVVLPRMRADEQVKMDGGVTIHFWGYEKAGGGFFDVDVYEVSIPGVLTVEIKLRIAHPLLQTPEDAMTHINVKFIKVEHSPAVHGVLGQTFRDGREQRAMDYTALSHLIGRDVAADSEAGDGFLDGKGADYRTSSVLSADCKFSSMATVMAS